MQRRKTILIASTLLIFTLACNLGTPVSPTPNPLSVDGGIETAVINTLQAGGVMRATPVLTYTPSVTPLPPFTPTPSLTPTPNIPIVSVSVDTSCRSGPGAVYTYLGSLLVGEKAQVVGKHTPTNYWIIVNPDGDGDCWLWGQHATVNGGTDRLMEYIAPAIPTPTIPNAPSNFVVSIKNCGTNKVDIQINWTDNSFYEDGFKLYQNNGLTHIIGYNRTSHFLSLNYTPNQVIRLELASFNVTGESAHQVVEIICP